MDAATSSSLDSYAAVGLTASVIRNVINAALNPIVHAHSEKDEDGNVVDELPLSRFLCTVTTDTASVPKAVFSADAPWVWTGCMAHKISLLFDDLKCGSGLDGLDGNSSSAKKSGPFASKELHTIISDCKQLLMKFAHSAKVQRNFEAAWKELYMDDSTPLKPVYDVVTRWSSTFFLLTRFACLWRVLERMDFSALNFSDDLEWAEVRARIGRHMIVLPELLAMLEKCSSSGPSASRRQSPIFFLSARQYW